MDNWSQSHEDARILLQYASLATSELEDVVGGMKGMLACLLLYFGSLYHNIMRSMYFLTTRMGSGPIVTLLMKVYIF